MKTPREEDRLPRIELHEVDAPRWRWNLLGAFLISFGIGMACGAGAARLIDLVPVRHVIDVRYEPVPHLCQINGDPLLR